MEWRTQRNDWEIHVLMELYIFSNIQHACNTAIHVNMSTCTVRCMIWMYRESAHKHTRSDLSHRKKKAKTTLLSIESWLFKKRDPHFMVYEAIPTYLGSISLDTHAGLPHHSWHPKMETFVLHHEWNGPRSLGKTIRECQEPKPFNHIFLKRWEMSSFRKCCYIKVVVPTHICVKLGIFS